MLHRFHDRFGTVGVVIAVIALIAALGGTAYAATKLNATQKKEVEKLAKKYAGKPGATGPQGSAGAKGEQGIQGNAGKNIEVGTATSTPNTGECPEVGGATVQVAGEAATKKHVCNGSPWPAGGTLPTGKTETGTWSVFDTLTAETSPTQVGSISFPIPLAAKGPVGTAFAFNKLKTENEEFGTSGCTGTVGTPTAPAGKLCVYTAEEERVLVQGFINNVHEAGLATLETFGKSGAVLDGVQFEGEPSAPARILASGSWAVTAP